MVPHELLNFGLFGEVSNYYDPDYEVEYPTNSGNMLNSKEAAEEVSKRLLALFVPDSNQKITMYGEYDKFQKDTKFNKNHLFFEYFDGYTGKRLGANHQTGWTGPISEIIQHLYVVKE